VLPRALGAFSPRRKAGTWAQRLGVAHRLCLWGTRRTTFGESSADHFRTQRPLGRSCGTLPGIIGPGKPAELVLGAAAQNEPVRNGGHVSRQGVVQPRHGASPRARSALAIDEEGGPWPTPARPAGRGLRRRDRADVVPCLRFQISTTLAGWFWRRMREAFYNEGIAGVVLVRRGREWLA